MMLSMHSISEISENGCSSGIRNGMVTMGKQNRTRRIFIVPMISNNYLQFCQVQLVNLNQYNKSQGVFSIKANFYSKELI